MLLRMSLLASVHNTIALDPARGSCPCLLHILVTPLIQKAFVVGVLAVLDEGNCDTVICGRAVILAVIQRGEALIYNTLQAM